MSRRFQRELLHGVRLKLGLEGVDGFIALATGIYLLGVLVLTLWRKIFSRLRPSPQRRAMLGTQFELSDRQAIPEFGNTVGRVRVWPECWHDPARYTH